MKLETTDSQKMGLAEKTAKNVDSFVGKYSKVLIAVVLVIVIALVVFGIVHTVTSGNREDVYKELYSLERSYYENIMAGDNTSEGYQANVDSFIQNAESFLASNNVETYPGAKAMLLLGDTYFIEENWSEANNCYSQIATLHEGDYLGSIALVNSAACLENMGDVDAAYDAYSQLWDVYGSSSALAPRALFNQARIVMDSDGAYSDYNMMSIDNGLGWSRWEEPGDIATHPKQRRS